MAENKTAKETSAYQIFVIGALLLAVIFIVTALVLIISQAGFDTDSPPTELDVNNTVPYVDEAHITATEQTSYEDCVLNDLISLDPTPADGDSNPVDGVVPNLPTQFSVCGVVVDLNGYSELQDIVAQVYSPNIDLGCEDDPNSCVNLASCTIIELGEGGDDQAGYFSCDVETLHYPADPDTWNTAFNIQELPDGGVPVWNGWSANGGSGAMVTSVNVTEMLSVYIDETATIDFGSGEVGDFLPASHMVYNTGNVVMDVVPTAGSTYMLCDGGLANGEIQYPMQAYANATILPADENGWNAALKIGDDLAPDLDIDVTSDYATPTTGTLHFLLWVNGTGEISGTCTGTDMLVGQAGL